jgi:predicted metalloprotease with PDZ domain
MIRKSRLCVFQIHRRALGAFQIKWGPQSCLLVAIFVALARLAAAASEPSPLGLEYHLRLLRPSTHLIQVEIHVENVRQPSLDFVMPAWAPGRYAIYNFAKNVQQFDVVGAQGQPLSWTNTDKQTWRVDAQNAGGALTAHYFVFANDLTGSFAQFDPFHANINGGAVYMYVAGHKRDPITLRVETPTAWGQGTKIFSGFSLSTSQRTFHAPNYDRLIDTPMEISTHDEATEFNDHGKVFRVVVHAYGEGTESASQWTKELADGLRKIVHSEMSMMPAPDFQAYTFLFHVTPFITQGDGMEHLDSTEIILRDETGSEALSQALEVAAHEFFHLWNVKRLRPAGLGPFDYTHEVYTRSLWFAEGVTQYYSYVHLLRSGVWSREDFLDRLGDEIRDYQREPGRAMMSAESSSFHAWFYDRAPQMQQTNFVNSTISYYNKGAILGMLMDLEIRARTEGRKSLDDVMRAMFNRFYDAPAATYYLPGRGYTEDDILNALDSIAGSDFTDFFRRCVQGTAPLPYDQALAAVGFRLDVSTDPGTPPSLGALTQPADTGVRILAVRPGGAADRAGLSRGDVLISVDNLSLATQPLRERLRMYPPGASVPFMVERYGERERILVKLDPPTPDRYTITELPNATPQQIQLRNEWLRQGAGK